MRTVTYYARPNCELCEEGLRVLKLVQEDEPFQIDYVDIEQDEQLHERFMLMIPVVAFEEEIIQYGQIDYPTILEALLESE